ncbi:kinesin-like protein KIN-14L isoform X1 [Cucurbita moschata]|uniref:Kinesin-like protein KIN-14L isoform X1 n=1 Tax=Cucurbita moschata TaxID=3662 RepID=A0A6J1GI19_CUCMO|nr:kinesin-like protein KIN-14L isoform X1 [Cucurbita moschata]
MDYSSINGLHNFGLTLASRRAEEAAWRRYEAVRWLESFVGPLGLPTQPSEMEFISCLRNGLVLCNAINKIQPGSVPKVVDNPCPLQSLTWECQPLPAYQYFENVRNFLVAARELNLPAFEASDLERDTFEAKVVDCVLALKSLHESKQMSNENGFHKHVKSSPLVLHSAKKTLPRPLSTVSLGSCRRLDMSAMSEKRHPVGSENAELEELIVKSLVDCLVQEKENFDGDLLVSLRNGDKDPVRLFQKVVSICSDKSLQESFSEFDTGLKDELKERSSFLARSDIVLDDITTLDNSQKRCKACYKKKSCNHGELFYTQEKELLDLKALLSKTKLEFYDLQSQLQRDLKDLENQVQELSNAALGYHNVVQENRSLYNMVQDLKGNIRVYCRIRPSFNCSSKDVIEFIGEDGSLMLLDPLKPKKYGRKVFRFNRVFGPAAKQDDVFKDIQPLIRSVMDGYNVCVFAYGQTGSGKTHTMNGPSGGADKDFGINYLALNDLFQIQNVRKDIDYEINVQMVEIYNEQVRDLLVAESSITKLEIRSCTSDTGLSLPDATRHSVKSTADVLNLIKLGELNRAVSFTSMNNQSSRSHSILTVYVHGKDNSGSSIRSCLHLVDLAGSERIDKSEVTGDRLKEAQYINKSLSCLGDVIMALAQKNSHIPYRNSKLTLLLQDSLGGHAKTVMFAHVSPEEDSFSETLSTLKFAQNVSTVELGSACLNKESSEVVQLKAQVENLKKALANNEVEWASNKSKAPRSPRQVAERTPPRPRRLSIENCSSAKTELLSKEAMGKGSKTPSIRTRRSSLEGPKCINNDGLSTKLLEDGSKNQALKFQKCSIIQNSVPISRVSHSISNGTVALEMNHKAPARSPQGASYMKRTIDTKGTRIPSLQLPKTPEPPKHVRNDIQNQMQSDAMFPTDAQTPNLNGTASGKGSRIRRSMRTIGKLINGSEKRNRQNVTELHTPVQATSTCNVNLDISPLTTNSRMQRRQSLTGIQMTGSNTSRRSSLGGKPTDSNVQKVLDTRNARTPPPIRQSTQVTKRWL